MFDFNSELKKYGLTEEQYEACLQDASDKVQGLNDMDWQDIIDKYNLPINYDMLRKAQQPQPFGGAFIREYYAQKASSKAYSDNGGKHDDYLAKLQIQKDELQSERYKLQATKLELNRNNRQNSRFELFYENIANVISALEPPKFTREHVIQNVKSYALGIGDIHYGATFVSTNNQYSRSECQRRFNVLLNQTSDFVVRNGIETLKIVNVADTIQGILRMSDLQINDVSVVQCVVEIAHILAEFLNELSSVCDIEYYHVTSANHSQTRNLGSKASELASEDMEYIIANYISDLLIKNEKIDVIFDTSSEALDFDIFDFHCFAEHGHRIKNLNNCIKNRSITKNTIYSYGFIGHTHSSKEIIVGEFDRHNIEVLVIPSFIGSDPYADTLNVGSKAMAKIFEFDEMYGHTGSTNIILN